MRQHRCLKFNRFNDKAVSLHQKKEILGSPLPSQIYALFILEGKVYRGSTSNVLLHLNERECIFCCCALTTGVLQVIKTTVAKVLEAKETRGESQGQSCLGCGVVCLTEDESVHFYFLQLYCVKVRGSAELLRDSPPTHVGTHTETCIPLPQ